MRPWSMGDASVDRRVSHGASPVRLEARREAALGAEADQVIGGIDAARVVTDARSREPAAGELAIGAATGTAALLVEKTAEPGRLAAPVRRALGLAIVVGITGERARAAKRAAGLQDERPRSIAASHRSAMDFIVLQARGFRLSLLSWAASVLDSFA
jgi:hypothetical protein